MLDESRTLGHLGPGSLEVHLTSIDAFLARLPAGNGRQAVDLGSGGGVPGLGLALAAPDWAWMLLDGSVSRCGFLAAAVERLGMAGRVRVVAERAEVTGRGPLRSAVGLVVARSFGPPAVLAECAAPLLSVGGVLLVAEPPGGAPTRWPVAAVTGFGLEVGELTADPVAIQALRQVMPCPERYPRRVGVPAKRPLF